MTYHIFKAYNLDNQERLHGLEPVNNVGYKVEVNEVRVKTFYEDQYIGA